jgi:hypothetical protein
MGFGAWFMNWRKWLHPKSFESVKVALYIVSLIDIVVSFSTTRTWRLSPWLRPFIFVMLTSFTRNSAFSSIMVWYNVADILLMICILLILFAWIGLVLWQGTPGEGVYFTGYLIALRELQVALTTANFPDIMVPAYNQSSFAILFYLAFFIVGLFFLIPFMLASIYNTYKLQLHSEAMLFHVNQRRMLRAAFYVLDDCKDGNLPSTIVNPLIAQLNKFIFVPYISLEKKVMILQYLDESHDNLVKLLHFSKIKIC